MVTFQHFTGNSSQRRKQSNIMTAHKVEKQTTLRRAEESRISDLLRYANQSQKLCNAAKNEVMISNARKSSFIAQVAAESLEQERLEKQNQELQMKQYTQVQNQRFAEQISHRNKERQKMELEIQRICETSEELKELERNLRIAYVNKERAAQHQEAILLKKLEQAREYAIDERMEEDRQLEIQRNIEKNNLRREELSKQKDVLQKQIQQNKELAQKMKEEEIKDKEVIDAIVAKINLEDTLELEERQRKKEETRKLVQQFHDEREKHKLYLKEQEKKQEEEIQNYNHLMEERKNNEEKRKKAMEEEKRIRWEKITEETKSQTQSKELFEELRNMLWQEELEEKRAKEEKERALERARRKKEMMRDNQAQIKSKREMIAQMEEEERRLVDVMLAKFAADEQDEKKRIELLRLEKEQFVQEAYHQRKERALMFQREKEKEIKERNCGAQQEEYRRRVVAEARRKLLAQHATQLKGFLPKGAILNDEEAQIISDV